MISHALHPEHPASAQFVRFPPASTRAFFLLGFGGGGKRWMSVWSLVLGRPLATDEQEQQKIGPMAGVPAMGLDGLTSSAYGPEAALTILLPLGAAGLSYIGPIMLVILALLGILYFS